MLRSRRKFWPRLCLGRIPLLPPLHVTIERSGTVLIAEDGLCVLAWLKIGMKLFVKNVRLFFGCILKLMESKKKIEIDEDRVVVSVRDPNVIKYSMLSLIHI